MEVQRQTGGADEALCWHGKGDVKYMRPLLERIEKGEIDPSFIITHRLKLSDALKAYETFRDKKDGCIKVVMTP